MTSLETLKSLVDEKQVDTVITAFPDLYGRMMGKRFDASFFLDNVAVDGTHGCNYLATVDMEMEPVEGYDFANWSAGYGDFHLQPDFDSLHVATWLDRTAIIFCDVIDDSSHDLVTALPRSILKKQIAAASQQGFTAKAASELEYYLFKDGYENANGRAYHNLQPAGWYLEDYHILHGSRNESYHGELRRQLAASGIPVESTKGEWGLGQHEINVVYSDIREMADRHILIKQCAKEIADAQELSVTFMAKYKQDQAGSSCHIHLSLWNESGNAFAGEDELGRIKCSPLFKSFLAGWISHASEFMPFYAPTVNSYKRYQHGSWAPTTLAWSLDNRTAGFRVVGHDQSLRIECRIPGADCNPYLAFAAALASGLDGIKNNLPAPDEFLGNAYDQSETGTVPVTFGDAIAGFEQSDFVRSTLGSDVHKHYTHFFKTEKLAFESAVTDWERIRYFERI
ncbi:MAG TPA: glutamine synthetase [Planctomycetaceae bacterium]|jgi:glutamine synthetase|nr:glutamine synthetase family protein [Pirellulales bacterium]HCP83646.1 glutamine synthetase [Planctomycetaceae bacterium]|tara:strand:+ start:637 stop:1998 length:1362 start_codon:yes stop_codon:yes gene_type:complete